MVNSPTKPEAKAAEYGVDIPMSGGSHKISENSRKSRETKKVVDDTTVLPLTSSPVMEEEEAMRSQPVIPLTMVDKLTKTVNERQLGRRKV